FDAYNWWVGQRFATLVKGKDAERIVTEETARLAKNPSNNQARLRLAYALRSQGKDAEAEKTLRAIPWTEFADREKRPPLRLATFP
ncbi:MAG: tetratricopeptide repeat protein, partial [Proteobacteria bacterium]